MILERIIPVKRIAILIGNNRWGGDFLPGVEADMGALKAYLRSATGGAWNEHEIVVVEAQ